MPHICPRPCSRLATAAVFISVGVVQFIVGILFLRSDYVYLLAGPDFWTSSCNIIVGCLLGVSASVWKRSRKRESKKHAIRRNLLLALLFSTLTLNATTLGLLLLGKGSTLLSIQLESSGMNSDAVFKREVLAYAFVTSVCCPIVCIVVCIVSMSGTFFKYRISNKAKEMNTPLNDKERSRTLRWIYTPELLDLSKKKLRQFMSSSAESSSEDELATIPKHSTLADSSEDIHRVLNRMAQGKRDTLLSDSTIMLRQLDLRRKNRYDSMNQDGSYIGPQLSLSRESGLNERNFSEDNSAGHDESSSGEKPRRGADVSRNARSPVEAALRRATYSKNKQLASYKNPYTPEELLDEFQSASSQMSKHFPSQYRKYRELQSRSTEVDGLAQSSISDVLTDYGSEGASSSRKSAKLSECIPIGMSRSTECISQKPNCKSSSGGRRFESVKEISSGINDCLSTDGSEFEEDSALELCRASSWAGEVIPINVKHSPVAKLSSRLIPVASPIAPVIQSKQEVNKISDDSGIGTIESNSFSEVTSQQDFKDRKNNLSTFIEDPKFVNKVGSQSSKKFDLNKVSPMASISEEPNSEKNQFEDEMRSQDGTIHKPSTSYSKKKSSEILKQTNQKADNLEKNMTSKRKSASGKSLKKIWSMASAENQTKFLDQVVDEDSLIGLTEEELIARQIRTRSIRRTIQQRIKEEIAV